MVPKTALTASSIEVQLEAVCKHSGFKLHKCLVCALFYVTIHLLPKPHGAVWFKLCRVVFITNNLQKIS